MHYPTWNDRNFLTREEAEAHVDVVMPRQVGKCCPCIDMGYHCLLFEGHSGNHEAWGVDAYAKQLLHSWPNRNTVHTI